MDLRRQARNAGLLYLLIASTAWIGLLYVPGALFVSGDAAATAAHLRASESLVRGGIASELFHQIVQIYLVLALYRLFRSVSVDRARELVILGALVPAPIVFVNILNEIAALMLVSGAKFLAVFTPAQLEALAYLFLRLHGQGIRVAAIFWGLWLIPFGWLVIRSRFIPRVLGVLLLIAGSAYLADEVTALVLPQFARSVEAIASVLELGELPIILWLVIWGARPRS